MGFLETLAAALPDFTFDVEIVFGDKKTENTERQTVIVDGVQEEFVRRTDDKEIIDVGKLGEDQRRLAQEALFEEWDSAEELFRESTEQYKQGIESTIGNEEIENTLSFFRPILPEHYSKTLEAALHFRKQLQMFDSPERGWTRERRRDIAEKYDGQTYQVINLCSAGYFDDGRYLRQLYEQMRAEDDYREGEYADVFEQIVNHRPFTIFVSSSQQPSDVKQEIYSSVKNKDRFDMDVEFIDVRGIGHDNRQKIEEALKRITEEVGDFDISVRKEDPELVIRIDPETISLP